MGILQKGKANIIIDGQWGSCGKGKLAGYLIQKERPDLVICDYMPNAGHVYVDNSGHATTFCQIPVGAMFGVPCLLGPHACIDVSLFFKELEMASGSKVWIHPFASIILDEDREEEKVVGKRIANTAKGGHSANAKKAMRTPNALLAKDIPELRPFLVDTCEMAQVALKREETLFIETAQGFDLSLNHGTVYPYVTGRDCMVGRALDNAGVPVTKVGSIVGCLRTFPIRVGNTADGTSGPHYPDQKELSWEDLAQLTGVDMPPEKTTVTKRVRRVFTFSQIQLHRFLDHVGPTHMFLNFVNYLREGINDEFVWKLHDTLAMNNCELSLLGTGAKDGQMRCIVR